MTPPPARGAAGRGERERCAAPSLALIGRSPPARQPMGGRRSRRSSPVALGSRGPCAGSPLTRPLRLVPPALPCPRPSCVPWAARDGQQCSPAEEPSPGERNGGEAYGGGPDLKTCTSCPRCPSEIAPLSPEFPGGVLAFLRGCSDSAGPFRRARCQKVLPAPREKGPRAVLWQLRKQLEKLQEVRGRAH